jgi:phage gp36-like protein
VPAYATRADLAALGVSEDFLAGLNSADIDRALEAASARADGYLRGRVTLPLKPPYGVDLVEAVAKLAAAALHRVRGAAPEADNGLSLRDGEKDAVRWLESVSDGTVTPTWADSSDDGALGYDGPFVVSPDESPRGW